MDFLKKNQIAIAAAVIFALGLWVYSTFIKKDAEDTLNDASAQEIGGEVLKLNSSLQSVSLNQSLFEYTLYTDLEDFSEPLAEQPVGRVNPFELIGRE